jgi:hypothetical protein
MLDKISLLNSIAYVILSAVLVSSHYYGILFVMANFILYHAFKHSFKLKMFIGFLICNIVIALSFMPYFVCQVFYRNYYFDRGEITVTPEFIGIFTIILCLAFIIFS